VGRWRVKRDALNICHPSVGLFGLFPGAVEELKQISSSMVRVLEATQTVLSPAPAPFQLRCPFRILSSPSVSAMIILILCLEILQLALVGRCGVVEQRLLFGPTEAPR